MNVSRFGSVDPRNAPVTEPSTYVNKDPRQNVTAPAVPYVNKDPRQNTAPIYTPAMQWTVIAPVDPTVQVVTESYAPDSASGQTDPYTTEIAARKYAYADKMSAEQAAQAAGAAIAVLESAVSPIPMPKKTSPFFYLAAAAAAYFALK